LALSFSLSSQTNPDCPGNAATDGFNVLVQVVGGQTITREYILYLPENYDSNQETPVVINFHGFGGCASDYAEEVGEFYELHKLADEKNFIVVYPQAAYRPEKEDVYWEPGDNGSQNIYENDVYFTEQLILGMFQTHNIDLTKIYACGYSNGGMMTYSLACSRPNLFAAIGIMSGTMLDENCVSGDAVPVIKFHGIEDGVLPYNGSIWYQSVSEVVNFWLDHNDIPESSLITSSLNEGKIGRDEYVNENNSACVTLYTVFEEWDKPGDHVWFSDQIEGLTPNELLWNFFVTKCSLISSTKEESDLSKLIEIAPNPVEDQMVISSNIGDTKKYEIIDQIGSICQKGTIANTTQTIDCSNLIPGAYVLSFDGQRIKFIKAK